jgi:hypothetical protein
MTLILRRVAAGLGPLVVGGSVGFYESGLSNYPLMLGLAVGAGVGITLAAFVRE